MEKQMKDLKGVLETLQIPIKQVLAMLLLLPHSTSVFS